MHVWLARCLVAAGSEKRTVASRIDDTSIPVGSMHLRESLTVATTARTTRFCRTRQRRSSCAMPIAHGSTRPAITQSRRHCPRPPHSGPRFVTTREPPLRGPEQGFNTLIPNFGKEEYFCPEPLTGCGLFCPSGKWSPTLIVHFGLRASVDPGTMMGQEFAQRGS